MDSISENKSYDYESKACCGFSNFPDGFKFKYNDDGDVCLSTDCSSWAKKLVHDMPLSDYIESESFVPPKVLHLPEFGNFERKKKRKETVGNYIEDCEYCWEYMDKTFNFCGNLVCARCNDILKNDKCKICGEKNMFAELFCNEGLVYTKECEDQSYYNMMTDYCNKCKSDLSLYFAPCDEEEYEQGCRVCRGPTAGEGDICYYCRIDFF
jgi:hypothetical protein